MKYINQKVLSILLLGINTLALANPLFPGNPDGGDDPLPPEAAPVDQWWMILVAFGICLGLAYVSKFQTRLKSE